MVDDAAVESALRFLVPSATQPEPARTSVSYAVRRRNGGYEILRDGVPMDVQFDPMQVLDVLYRRTQTDALKAWPGATVLKALTGCHHGERFLVVGESRADCSHVGLELLALGADVQGDDLAILDGDQITAYPRPLRVIGDSARLPPGAPPLAALPSVAVSQSTNQWALDLAAAGLDWRISAGRCDVVIGLETNYGGQSRLAEMNRRDMARDLMSCSEALGDPLARIRTLAGLVDQARCYRLRLGNVSDVAAFWPSRVS